MDARGKEDEKMKIPTFQCHELEAWENVRKANQLARKHLFVSDVSGKCITSLNYNQYVGVCEAHGEIKKVIIAKKQSKGEAAANLRKAILADMRHGRQTVMHIDTMVAQWKDYAVKPFFDFDKCQADIKTIITPDEDHDMHNNPKMFEISKDWNIIILFNNSGEFSDDETVQMNIDEVVEAVGADVWNNWEKIYLKPVE